LAAGAEANSAVLLRRISEHKTACRDVSQDGT
jgi:hypothetical protein